MNYALIFIAAWNVITYLLMGFDKRQARRRGFRVSESVLLSLALFGGGLGSLIGMVVFHHKTQNSKFQIIVPMAALVTLLLIIKIILDYAALG